MLRVAIFAALAMAGCTSRSGVIADGPGTYMIIIAGKTGFSPVGSLKIKAYEQASAYCTASGRTMETIKEKSVPTGFLRFPEAEVHFRCN